MSVKEQQPTPDGSKKPKLSWEEWYPSVNPATADRMTSGPVVISIVLIMLGLMAAFGYIGGL